MEEENEKLTYWQKIKIRGIIKKTRKAIKKWSKKVIKDRNQETIKRRLQQCIIELGEVFEITEDDGTPINLEDKTIEELIIIHEQALDELKKLV